MKKLGFIGTGNMATAISNGILKQAAFKPSEIMAYNPNRESLERFTANGILAASSVEELMESCHYILLAVKPQMFPDVLASIAPFYRNGQVIISIAAGISSDYIRNYLSDDAKVVLAMPNTPMLIGEGTVSMAFCPPATREEFEEVIHIFRQSAYVCEVTEDQMIKSIPLHGSSPAMFYLLAQNFVEKAVAQGFEPQVANELVCKAMIGAANMMLQTGKTHEDLIKMVCSKGGTTLAMLDALENHGFSDSLSNGFDACLKRAYELGK